MDPIPHIIHQTHKSREFVKSNEKLSDAAQSWIDTGYDYRFYDDTRADNFMKTLEDEFPGIYNIYDQLPIPVMKADLFRYCIVYKVGGIYADADTVLVDGKIDKLVGYTGFVCVSEINQDDVCQWVFSASKDCPVLKKVIQFTMHMLSSANIENELRDDSTGAVLDLTGPKVFTRAFREYLIENGESQDIVNTPNVRDIPREILSRNKILMHPDDFNHDTVVHLFASQWESGWWRQVRKLHNDLNHNHDLSIEVLKIISAECYPDTFTAWSDGNKLSVQRTDSTGGWGQDTLEVSALIHHKDGKTEEKTIHIGCSMENIKDIMLC